MGLLLPSVRVHYPVGFWNLLAWVYSKFVRTGIEVYHVYTGHNWWHHSQGVSFHHPNVFVDVFALVRNPLLHRRGARRCRLASPKENACRKVPRRAKLLDHPFHFVLMDLAQSLSPCGEGIGRTKE